MNRRAAKVKALSVLAEMIAVGEPPDALTDGLCDSDAIRAEAAWREIGVEMDARVERLVERVVTGRTPRRTKRSLR
jgi:hypothetical protein